MIINGDLLNKVNESAKTSPRLRMNFNLHESFEAKAQRLINILLPGTPMPIHRHKHTAETCCNLRGKRRSLYSTYTGRCVKLMERILLCKPRMSGREIDFIKAALADDWAVPLGPDCDAFEHELEKYIGKNKKWQRLHELHPKSFLSNFCGHFTLEHDPRIA